MTEDGLVITNHGGSLIVETRGTLVRCRMRGRTGAAVSGDRVRWHALPDGTGMVDAVLSRRSLLARPDPRGRTRPIVANVDQIIVVVAPEPCVQLTLLDRYLVVAELQDLASQIVCNKSDLLDVSGRKAMDDRLEGFRAVGYNVTFSSARTAQGIDGLREIMRERSSILVGQSGVGKSSLVKRLVPNARAAVGGLSQGTMAGRHTTSATTLYRLADGGALIDSPGVRDFGLWHLEPHEVGPAFPEFRAHLTSCRFRDCLHLHEPGCAVLAACERGEVERRRLESYHQMLSTLRDSGSR